MTPTDFTYILQNPEHVSSEKTEALKLVIEAFPYFQSARALLLKGLKNQNSFNYNQELKTTAAYTTDRSMLFDFITSETFAQNEISKNIKQNAFNLKHINVEAIDISINKKVTVDTVLQQQINETSGVLDPQLFQPKDISTSKVAHHLLEETTAADTENQKPDAVLNIGAPFTFNKTEIHSFNEWLKLTQLKPIERDDDETLLTEKTVSKEDKKRSKKFALIDKFITTNPKINPNSTTVSKENLAKANMIQPETLMTETLARIYLEQKNYKKAIQSYKILSLKYPEKSSFFANQIRAIEHLQEQNNNK
ncbi:MAG: hypothetical protein ACK5NB_08155 [Flavobacteriaceae bacterium]